MTPHIWVKIEPTDFSIKHQCTRCGVKILRTERFDAISGMIYKEIYTLNPNDKFINDCDIMLINTINDL